MNAPSLLPRAVRVIISLVVAMVCSAGAVAQTAQEVPSPVLTRTAPAWLGYLIMFVLLVGVMVVSLIPSKRGHQD